MAAVVTDQFRILNAENFVASVADNTNSYYAFLSLSNPTSPSVGFGRDSNWNTNTPNPPDNFSYNSHYRDTSLFGKKLTSSNVRRIVKKRTWTKDSRYDMYRHDYGDGAQNVQAPVSKALRLYDADYYVINKDFKVYVCIENGSTGSKDPEKSIIEPIHTGVGIPAAGSDRYRWKYLFTISPSDVIKFDSTEYIVLPNDWATASNTSDIGIIREGGNSDATGDSQITTVFIKDAGTGLANTPLGGITVPILGDGENGLVNIIVKNGSIESATVTNGGKGYTYGIVQYEGGNLIPIIPPSKGHGYDIYKELGAEKVLMYARFDDSTKDFPVDTVFSQVGIIKNPEKYSGSTIFTENTFSSLGAIMLDDSYSGTPVIGSVITQVTNTNNDTAKAYVASYDKETKVLKYYQDRSLYLNQTTGDHTGSSDVATRAKVVSFVSSSSNSNSINVSGIGVTMNVNQNQNFIIKNNKKIDLGVTFTGGLANPEINKKTGDIIYIDNRPSVTRDSRQKEDVKIILEF